MFSIYDYRNTWHLIFYIQADEWNLKKKEKKKKTQAPPPFFKCIRTAMLIVILCAVQN